MILLRVLVRLIPERIPCVTANYFLYDIEPGLSFVDSVASLHCLLCEYISEGIRSEDVFTGNILS